MYIHVYIRHREHGGAFEGHRVSQYLIAPGGWRYECCLDTSEIARREGLESDAEMGNGRKEGRKEGRKREFVRCLSRNLAVITPSTSMKKTVA